jgi:hypothetical protein
MCAILMIGASHLAYLNPENETYKKAELEYATAASHGLREALESAVDEGTANALFMVGIMLCNHAWSSSLDVDDLTTSAIDMDLLVPLGTGIRRILLSTEVWMYIWRSEIFAEAIAFSPKLSLDECANRTVFPLQLHVALRNEYQSIWPTTDDDPVENAHFEAYMVEATRLIPVVAVLKLGRCGIAVAPLEQAIVRYLYTWPIILFPDFVEMINQKHKSVELLFYHYYKAVEAGIPEKYWWAQRRTKYMIQALGSRLRDKSIVPVDLLAVEPLDWSGT